MQFQVLNSHELVNRHELMISITDQNNSAFQKLCRGQIDWLHLIRFQDCFQESASAPRVMAKMY